MSGGWRHHIMRATGLGTVVPVLWDAPLSGVAVAEDLSGPGAVDCTVSPEHPNVDRSMLVPWSSVIVSELEGQIRGVGIVENIGFDGPDLAVTCVGFAGYLNRPGFNGDIVNPEG